MQLHTQNTHNWTVGRGREPCPPHGPHLVLALEGGSYVVRCLACGLEGPERKDSMEAKRAFDEALMRGQQLEPIHLST